MSFKEKFFAVKRRTTQNVLQRMGKAQASPDTEYEERKSRAMKLLESLKQLHKHSQAYLDHTRSLCFASAELSTDFKEFFHGGDARVVRIADQFHDSMHKVDEETRKIMDDRIVEEVMEPLQGKLAQFDELRGLMKQREAYKVDYDAYLRNVRRLKEKASSNARKLGEKERKLAAAKKLLEDATAECFYRFDTFEDRRTIMVLNEFRTITSCLATFYQTSAGMLAGLGDIPRIEPPPERERPVISLADGNDGAGAGSGAGDAPPASAATPPAASAPAPAPPKAGGAKCRAKALYDYAPQNGDELALSVDDVIDVLNKQEDGWWEGSCNGRRGVFPANYVEEI